MEKYYTMVMDLYRDAITGNYQVNQSTEVKKRVVLCHNSIQDKRRKNRGAGGLNQEN